MKGYTFHKIWVIICEACNENIIERADELLVVTRADAEEYARANQAQHDREG